MASGKMDGGGKDVASYRTTQVTLSTAGRRAATINCASYLLGIIAYRLSPLSHRATVHRSVFCNTSSSLTLSLDDTADAILPPAYSAHAVDVFSKRFNAFSVDSTAERDSSRWTAYARTESSESSHQ